MGGGSALGGMLSSIGDYIAYCKDNNLEIDAKTLAAHIVQETFF